MYGLDHIPAVAARHQYGLKVWCGMSLSAWTRLLLRNRFAVGPRYLHLLGLITLSALRNTLLGSLQERVWGKRIRETPIVRDPLFVIGHWRSGTTLLHELLSLDDGHAFPTTYQCFFASHFLLTERYANRILRRALPQHRYLDQVPMGWDRPMEDEFALCSLGQPSPYLLFAFPNRPQWRESFDLEGLPRELVTGWKQCLIRFLKQITVRQSKRIVLKSPTHTYRLGILMEMFPNAQFIHIVRDPHAVFPSTVYSSKASFLVHGLQRPNFEGLQDAVIRNYVHMYERFEQARPLLQPSRLHELRYEDLVRDPLGEMRQVYDHLQLGDFERARPRLKAYMAKAVKYRTNPYSVPPELQQRINQLWGPIMERFDYS